VKNANVVDEETRQRRLANGRRCYEKHKKQRAEAKRRYKLEHPELVADRQRQAVARYRERHKSDPKYQERVRATDRARWPKRKLDPQYRETMRAADQRFKAKHRDDPAFRSKNCERQIVYLKTNGKTVANAISKLRRLRKRQAEGSFTAQEWRELLGLYDHRCLCCGGRFESGLVPDHVVALSRGGSNWISNIQPLCKICNSEKGTKNIDYRQVGKLN
jgi:hypothetical protein